MIPDTNIEDLVNHPSHYTRGEMECIHAIKAASGANPNGGFQSYLQGVIIKYLWRYPHKNGIEDLRKAEWYLNQLIREMKK
jgi:hypothetical protein